MKKRKMSDPTSRIIIKGEGRDEWKNRYFKLAVKGSDVELPPFSMEQISSAPESLYNALSNAGLNIFTRKAKNAVLELLQGQQKVPSTFKVATRLGWNSGAIVRPDEIVGSPRRPLETEFGNLAPQTLAKYRSRGTLEEWQTNIASICTDNSRLIFAVSLAFTGPILRFVRGNAAAVFSFGVTKRPARPRRRWWPVPSGVATPERGTRKSGLPKRGTPPLTRWKSPPSLITTVF